jgi:cation diffusion facilitator CzcD-associated flavoprotein CzcO
VQLIQEVAKSAEHLTIFQRSPNWCAPLHNSSISEEEMSSIKDRYKDIFEACKSSFAGFIHTADSRKALDVTAAERNDFYEELYASPGFGIWMGNFRDVLVDEEANKTLSEFVERKIRERVNNPEIAEKLVPKDHGFGTRRVPMETRYYEVYNQENVLLVDLNETPIEAITTQGITTTQHDYDFDLVIYATGFDAVMGHFNSIDFVGSNGKHLREKWSSGPRTYLGMSGSGFPHMFTLVGPHNAATFFNQPRCIEQNVEWVSDFVAYFFKNKIGRVEASELAENSWTEHVYE